MDHHQHAAQHHAVMIGINSYDPKGSRLSGCVRDVEEIALSLRQSVGNLRIHSFTASLDANSPQPTSTEPRERWPTYDNISSCLHLVTQEARRGDHVYIHFSGHGTVIPPSQTEPDWDDSGFALVVLDEPDASKLVCFPSIELAEHLRDIVDKGVSVTVVLDCCYSGSTWREDETVRYLPYHPEMRARNRRKTTEAPSTVMELVRPALRGRRRTSLRTDWLANPEGYAILTSSDATEMSFEVKFDRYIGGPRHGALTFFLLETFDMLGGVGGAMEQLYECVSAKIRDHRRHHQKKMQSPVLLGNEKLLFFGRPSAGCAGDIPVTSITEDGRPEIGLRAGAAHGVTEDDQFTLRPLGLDTSLSGQWPVLARATRVRGITSDLEVVAGDAGIIKTGWLATATTRLSLRQFPIWFDVSTDSRDGWREELRQHVSLAEATDAEHVGHGASGSADGWSFAIVQVNDTAYKIQDDRGRAVATLEASESPQKTKKQLLDYIYHLASFKLVRDLTNKTDTSSEMQRFKTSFAAVFVSVNDAQTKTYNPGCSITGELDGACYHPECLIPVTQTERLSLRVYNTEDATGPNLYLYIYAMGSRWEIESPVKASRTTIAPKGGGPNKDALGVDEKEFHFSLDEGQTGCEDILKVFLTGRPTSFTTLTLPNLGESADSRAVPDLGGVKRKDLASEAWVALTFRIYVKRAPLVVDGTQ